MILKKFFGHDDLPQYDDKLFKRIVVHGGTFHPDDVLCVAYAKALFPDIEVIRTNNVTQDMLDDTETLVCDIGKEYNPDKFNFDHHNDCPVMPNGVKKSAIGLMLGDERIYECLQAKFKSIRHNSDSEFNTAVLDALTTIQAIDNGEDISDKKFYSKAGDGFSETLYGFNPVWDSDLSTDEAFDNAVKFATSYFVEPSLTMDGWGGRNFDIMLAVRNEHRKAEEAAKDRASSMLHESLDNMNSGVVVLSKYCPWQDTLCPTDAKFVVFPSSRGGYMLQCVPPKPDSFDKKIELPDWNNSENKPEGMIFEHLGKFLAQFETEQQAVAAGVSVVREYNKTSKSLPVKDEKVIRDGVDIDDSLEVSDLNKNNVALP